MKKLEQRNAKAARLEAARKKIVHRNRTKGSRVRGADGRFVVAPPKNC